jgi:hypothetical protein
MIVVVNDPGQREQFGAHRQASPSHCIHVDIETNPSFVYVKLDSSAALDEFWTLANDRRARTYQAVEDFRQVSVF